MHCRGRRLESVEKFITWMREVDYIARPDTVNKDYTKPKVNAAELLKMRTLPETKVCRVCKEEKPASEFNVAPTNTDGLQGICRECTRKQRRKYYLAKHK